MGAVDAPESGVKHKKGRRRKPKRIGIKIDMTPMVDVAFLLLIFFMCTTVFRKPQALEINLPPDPNAKVEIAESNVMTLRVIAPEDSTRGGARAFWRLGKEPFQEVDVEKLQPIFAPEGKKNPKLAVVGNVDRQAEYRFMLDIICQRL